MGCPKHALAAERAAPQTARSSARADGSFGSAGRGAVLFSGWRYFLNSGGRLAGETP
ncbi:MAG: hypothetical protein JHD23_09730 [Akkermansiaceae bacterium]|nr:hypothetical protein [Akkermansiaceae bacterium]MBJ7424758.1 hypothetical protein [Akkermansiaceae bacterium]